MTERANVSGATKIVGLIGWPVAHSLSPAMHNAAFDELGLDYCYLPFPVSPEPTRQLGQAIQGLRALGIRGCNVTVPHKVRAISYADELSEFARLTGAVNTFTLEPDGRLVGDNTDGPGLTAYLHHRGVDVAAGEALVLGAGGAARAAVSGLLSAGCERITVLNRTASKAEALLEDMATAFPKKMLRPGAFPEDLAVASARSSLILQCSSLGMGSDALAWDNAVPLRSDQVVCDLVYYPRKTALLALAECRGARALDGVGMLVFQGALAFERWTGCKAPIDTMFRAVDAQLKGA